MPVTTVKYFSGHREHWYELEDEPKKQPKWISMRKKLATKIIMDCRTTASHHFRRRLGF